MTIDWSDNKSNDKLLVATHAALGKDAYSNRFGEIAHYFGEGVTYNAIKNRYKKIAQKAEQMQRRRRLHHRPTTTRRAKQYTPKPTMGPGPSRRRGSRSEEAPTLEPDSDDREIIRQALTRTSALGLRNASKRRPRIPVLVTQGWNSSSESEDISHGGDDEYLEDDDDEEVFEGASDIAPSATLAAGFPSSIEPVSSSYRDDMGTMLNESQDKRLTLNEHLPLDERMACSSQELAEQRARERQRYMDPLSPQDSTETPTPWLQPQPSTSSRREVEPTGSHASTLSFIDPTTATCMLCMLQWELIEHARKHEHESKKHYANLQDPELVHAAKKELARARASRTYVPGKTTEIKDSQALPQPDTSAPATLALNNSAATRASREPSVYEVPPPARKSKNKGKGKNRTAPYPPMSPRTERQDIAGRAMYLAGHNRKSGLRDAVETSVLLEDIALGIDREGGREPSSLRCDDLIDMDY